MRSYRLMCILAMFVLPALPSGRDSIVAQIPAIQGVPRMEDFIGTEPVSSGLLRISDFRQRQPVDSGTPGAITTAYLGYSKSALFVVFVCSDDPTKVRAHLGRRESVSGDDLVGVSLDTFHDRRRAYMFYANPLGVQLDGISTEGQPDDYKFDAVWSADGRLTATGYIIRFAIPFKSIRAKLGPSQTWGIALTRRIVRNDEYDTWPRITDKVEAYVPQFAAVNAPEQHGPSRDIILNPYGFVASQRIPDENALLRKRTEGRAGLDSKFVLNNGFTLDLTANPDFSQVESDEPQVTANRRYETYFPEKRPFFLENAPLFQTPETLFFSRRILDPQFGARATGKAGQWAFGLLAVDDRAPMNDDEAGGRAQIGVARVQRQFGRESMAGFLVTSRRIGAATNTVQSADLRWKLSSHWVLSTQAAHSSSVGVNGAGRRGGSDLFGELRYAGYHLAYSTRYRDRSPGFNADLGFIPRRDIRQAETEVTYRWKPETGIVTSFGPSAYAVITHDHAGKLQDWSLEMPFTVNLRGPSSFSVAHTAGAEFFGTRMYRSDGNRAVVSTDRWKRLGLTASIAKGTAINYFPAAGQAPFGVASTDARFELTYHFSPRVRVDETYLYTRLATSAGRAVLDEHIGRSKLNVQFTRAASLRFILDYTATLANTGLIDLDRAKRLTGDVLFTYMIHPGTALYIGYNDRRENWLSPESNGSFLSRGSAPWAPTGRQVFFKVSYLFHL